MIERHRRYVSRGHHRLNYFRVPLHPPSQFSAKNTLRPVTVRQIISATQAHPDAEFKVDDQELGQVSPLLFSFRLARDME